jgi:hypothetical protein
VGSAAAAAAAGVAALSLSLAPAPAWVRGWGGVGAASWSVWLGASLAGVGSSGRALAVAVLGAAAVVGSGFGRRTLADVLPHAGAAGLVLPAVALALPSSGWARTGVVASWVLAAAAATAWSERRSSGPVGALATELDRRGLRRLAAVTRATPVVGVAAGLPFLAVGLAEGVGLTEGRRSWNGVVVATIGVVEAVAARALARRTPDPADAQDEHEVETRSLVGPTAAVAAFFTTLVGISLAAPDPWPSILALLAPVVATAVLGGELRRPAMTWVAWIASVALIVLLAERAGMSAPDLWIAGFAWGAVALVGGLALDDVRSGHRAAGETIRTTWLGPPVALGALAVPASLAFAFRGAPEWYGAWSLVGALLYLIVAVQLRAGAIAAASAALVTVSYGAFLPTSPWSEPILFVPWTALLVAISIAARRAARAADPLARWDLGILVVAHGVAILALTRSVAISELAPTWASFSALALLLGIALRRVEWAAAGALLLIVAAADAGPGWLALALAVSSLACGAAASRTVPRVRWGLQAGAAILAAGAWDRFLVWTAWSTPRAVLATTIVGVALLVLPAVVLKVSRLALDWAIALGALGLAASAAAAITARLPGAGISAQDAGLVATAGLAALAFALGVSASRVRLVGQREASALLGVLAIGQLGAAMQVPPAAGAAIAAAGGLLAVLAWIALWRARLDSPWLPSLGLVALAADVIALALAIDVLPRRDVLEAALLLTGVEFAVAGVALRRPHLITPAPAFVAAAWFVFASDAFHGELQWFTVPAGIGLLAVSAIERRANRLTERRSAPELLVVEYLGMALVVSVALVETISIGPERGLLAIAGGAGLTAWGAVTKVRRRAVFGAASVLVAVVLMLVGPLARLVPQVRGPALWGLIVGVGTVLLVAATMLERGRVKVAAVIRRLDTLMEGWE